MIHFSCFGGVNVGKRHVGLIYLALLLQCILHETHAIQYLEFCELSEATVPVQWSSELERFVEVIVDESPTSINTRTRTRTRTLERSSAFDENKNRYLRQSSSSSLSVRNTTRTENANANTYLAKQCPCASTNAAYAQTPYYCLDLNNENVCRVPAGDGQYDVQCYRHSPVSIFTRNALPVAVLWLAAMLLYMVFTEAGRSGLKYIFFRVLCRLCCVGNCCCHRFHGNSRLVEDIIRREAVTRRRFQAVVQHARMTESSRQSSSPTTYILKTREYKKSEDRPTYSYPRSPGEDTLPLTPQSTKSYSSGSEDEDEDEDDGRGSPPMSPSSSGKDANIDDGDGNDNYVDNDIDIDNDIDKDETDNTDGDYDEDNEVTCTICIMDIEDGDRIGVLPCNHKFHVDCLKQWIKRKNVCPNCQIPNIAREKECEIINNGHGRDRGSGSGSGEEGEGEGTNGNHQRNIFVSASGMQFVTRRTTGIGISQTASRGGGGVNSQYGRRIRRQRTVGEGGNSMQRELFQVNAYAGGRSAFDEQRGRGRGRNSRRIMVGDLMNPTMTTTVRVTRSRRRNTSVNEQNPNGT